jgi:uncharacterized repeat protein (TIGR03806 family)
VVRPAALVFVLALAMVSCDPPAPAVPEGPLLLSEWGLFEDMEHQIPSEGVIPFEVNAPLFSDYASKHRFIRVPEGEALTLDAEGRFVYPEGTVLVKTFGFQNDFGDPAAGERLIETRLLVWEDGVWIPLIYIYDDDLQEARLFQAGRRVEVSWITETDATRAITYRVPNAIQCGNCHGGTGELDLLGVRVDQLDREHDYGAGLENQLDHLVAVGALDAAPPIADRHPLPDPFDPAAGTLDARARAYLDANCSGCHRDGGAAHQTGLHLGVEIPASIEIGICKLPAAAGRGSGGRLADIIPGDAEGSIMVFRVESEEAGIKMPELPTVLHHAEGAALLRQWIDAMPPNDCGLAPAP